MSKVRRNSSAATTPRKPMSGVPHNGVDTSMLSLDQLAHVVSEGYVRVAIHDLVAYEYIDPFDHSWQWGLGTVAAIPRPRLVQLLKWTGGVGGAFPSSVSPVALEKARAQLKALRERRRRAETEVEELNQLLSTKEATYRAGRVGMVEEMQAAEQTLRMARSMVESVPEEDWREIRSYVKPPCIVVLVLEATMETLGAKTKSWSDILRVIRGSDFVREITDFNPDSIRKNTLRRLQSKYLQDPRFTYDDAMKGSRALGALQRWVVAQIATSSAVGGLVEYDLKNKEAKTEIDEMSERLARFQAALADYSKEEKTLCLQAGDHPVPIKHVDPRAPMPSGKPIDGDTHPAPSPVEETLFGVPSEWALTEESVVILRSSILVNYDAPPSTTVTLTGPQVEMLVEALRARASPLMAEQQAESQRARLTNALDEARLKFAEAKKELQDLQADRNEQLRRNVEENDEATDRPTAIRHPATQRRASGSIAMPSSSPPGEDTQALLDALAEKRDEVKRLTEALEEAMGPKSTTGTRDLTAFMDALTKQIHILKTEATMTKTTLEDIHTVIEANPALKVVMAEGYGR